MEGVRIMDVAPKKQVPARMPPALIDAVRREATKHRRTLAMEMTIMIEEALQARGVAVPSDPALAD